RSTTCCRWASASDRASASEPGGDGERGEAVRRGRSPRGSQDLGASFVHEKDEHGVHWMTFQDPEGNEFCVAAHG
ncbi:MAG: VOC family protein, partial [Acidimicrobiales bacterium]